MAGIVVVDQTYRGHDSMLTVCSLHDCAVAVLHARVPGAALFVPGSKVWISASGSAQAWPPPT